MSDPLIILLDNGQQIVVVTDNKEQLTMRVQSSTGHNRAVAKLSEHQSRLLWNRVGSWLAR